ncbi:hypothetical protein BD289DRAFT_421230, partial [Coniella lustricola]
MSHCDIDDLRLQERISSLYRDTSQKQSKNRSIVGIKSKEAEPQINPPYLLPRIFARMRYAHSGVLVNPSHLLARNGRLGTCTAQNELKGGRRDPLLIEDFPWLFVWVRMTTYQRRQPRRGTTTIKRVSTAFYTDTSYFLTITRRRDGFHQTAKV